MEHETQIVTEYITSTKSVVFPRDENLVVGKEYWAPATGGAYQIVAYRGEDYGVYVFDGLSFKSYTDDLSQVYNVNPS